MASRETLFLKANVESQLNRLLTQLQDIEDSKADLDDSEYNEMKSQTIADLSVFETSLRRLMEGDVTLVDQLSSVQMAIQAAIRQAFKTPEVIRMFARKEPVALRSRLGNIEGDRRLGRISEESYNIQASEILLALQNLGEVLSPPERNLLERQTKSLDNFTSTASDDSKLSAKAMSMASNHISSSSSSSSSNKSTK